MNLYVNNVNNVNNVNLTQDFNSLYQRYFLHPNYFKIICAFEFQNFHIVKLKQIILNNLVKKNNSMREKNIYKIFAKDIFRHLTENEFSN